LPKVSRVTVGEGKVDERKTECTDWESLFEPKERITFEQLCELANKNLRSLEDPNSYVTLARLAREPYMAYQKEKATPYEVTNPEIAKVGICLLEQDRYQDKTQTSPQSQLSSPNPLIVKRSGSPIFSQNQTKTKTNIGITPQDDSIQTFISNLTAGSKLKEKVNFIESQKKEFYAAR